MRLIKIIPTEEIPIHWLLIGTAFGAAAGWIVGIMLADMFGITGPLTSGLFLIANILMFAWFGSQMFALMSGTPLEDKEGPTDD